MKKTTSPSDALNALFKPAHTNYRPAKPNAITVVFGVRRNGSWPPTREHFRFATISETLAITEAYKEAKRAGLTVHAHLDTIVEV